MPEWARAAHVLEAAVAIDDDRRRQLGRGRRSRRAEDLAGSDTDACGTG